MPVGAVDADLETVAPEEGQAAVDPLQLKPVEHDVLVEPLQPGLFALAATVSTGELTQRERIEPDGYDRAGQQEKQQGA